MNGRREEVSQNVNSNAPAHARPQNLDLNAVCERQKAKINRKDILEENQVVE